MGNTYTVSNVEVYPHFSSTWAGLIIPDHSVSVKPSVGSKVTGDYVTVYFTVGSLIAGTSWDYNCKVYL